MVDHSTAVFLMAEAPMEEVSFKVSFLYSGNKTTSLPPHRRNTKLRPLHHSGNKTTILPPHRRNTNYDLYTTQATKLPACRPTGVIGSLHNEDDDGNENGKKEIG